MEWETWRVIIAGLGLSTAWLGGLIAFHRRVMADIRSRIEHSTEMLRREVELSMKIHEATSMHAGTRSELDQIRSQVGIRFASIDLQMQSVNNRVGQIAESQAAMRASIDAQKAAIEKLDRRLDPICEMARRSLKGGR